MERLTRDRADGVAPGPVCQLDETRREALARFLRERRENLAPDQVGIALRRGRRTPGLRREEVAFLADIGVKWYARLEAGDDIHPSAATLVGIAVALRLSNAELEYMLELAGLGKPLTSAPETNVELSAPILALLNGLRGVSATISDRILTPLRWNALADALYGHSRYDDPVERNALVRTLFDPDFIAFLGAERNEVIFRAVGIYRLNYSSQRPSPFAAGVLEKIKDAPLFQQAWKRRIVASELATDRVAVRNHPKVGKLEVYAIDLNVSLRSDLFLRTLVPANEETATKFELLEKIAKGLPANAGPSLVACS
jgi:transcriptional regulator with XRE-family HTH domain